MTTKGPTKAELVEENAQLRAEIADLERQVDDLEDFAGQDDPHDLATTIRVALEAAYPPFATLHWMEQDGVTRPVTVAVMDRLRGDDETPTGQQLRASALARAAALPVAS